LVTDHGGDAIGIHRSDSGEPLQGGNEIAVIVLANAEEDFHLPVVGILPGHADVPAAGVSEMNQRNAIEDGVHEFAARFATA